LRGTIKNSNAASAVPPARPLSRGSRCIRALAGVELTATVAVPLVALTLSVTVWLAEHVGTSVALAGLEVTAQVRVTVPE
jgi:hypothetical protein